MSGLGRKVWSAGDVVAAADVQGYLQDQTVMVFDDATARSSAIGTPTEGMATYLKDTNTLELYDGSSWFSADSEIPSQSGNADKYLTTDGTALSWGEVDALPSQTGNDGKYLTTDGTAASWATITTDPTPSVFLLMGA
jgi:hypothetical protein